MIREAPGAVLLLVGEGTLKERMRFLASKLGLGESVFFRFPHRCPGSPGSADIVTLTSKREGLPRVVMEGMAAGKPIVATNVRGSRDLVEDGGNGFLVPVDDPEKLARAMISLLKNPEPARNLGLEGVMCPGVWVGINVFWICPQSIKNISKFSQMATRPNTLASPKRRDKGGYATVLTGSKLQWGNQSPSEAKTQLNGRLE